MKMNRYKLLLTALLIVIGCEKLVVPDNTAPTVVITYSADGTTLTKTDTVRIDVAGTSDIIKLIFWMLFN